MKKVAIVVGLVFLGFVIAGIAEGKDTKSSGTTVTTSTSKVTVDNSDASEREACASRGYALETEFNKVGDAAQSITTMSEARSLVNRLKELDTETHSLVNDCGHLLSSSDLVSINAQVDELDSLLTQAESLVNSMS